MGDELGKKKGNEVPKAASSFVEDATAKTALDLTVLTRAILVVGENEE